VPTQGNSGRGGKKRNLVKKRRKKIELREGGLFMRPSKRKHFPRHTEAKARRRKLKKGKKKGGIRKWPTVKENKRAGKRTRGGGKKREGSNNRSHLGGGY